MTMKSILLLLFFLGLYGILNAQGPADPNATRKPHPPTKMINAPDIIRKADSLEAAHSSGTFTIGTVDNDMIIHLKKLLKSTTYSISDRNGNTVPSYVLREGNGCILCWDDCHKAVRIKCPLGK